MKRGTNGEGDIVAAPSESATNSWLWREIQRNDALLTRLRERLELTLDPREGEPDADGNPTLIPADVNESGTPSRDWLRGLGRYQTGLIARMTDARERAKMALVARLKGDGKIMTDEEFEQGMRTLAMNSVRELDTGDLVAELTRRGLTLPSTSTDPDGDAS